MNRQLSRRTFLETIGMTGVAACIGALSGCGGQSQLAAKRPREHGLSGDLIVVRGEDPKEMVRATVEALGGIDKLVRADDIVVVKPNMAWDRLPEQAATTNPDVVGTIVELCFKAGAKKVNVFDRTCNDARRSYDTSGIAKVAEAAGASVSYVLERKFRTIAIPQGLSMKEWSVYEDAARADVLINVPIAKHHGTSRLTLGLKNMMGVAGGNRGAWHPEIHQRLADFATVTAVDLTIVDAYRILTNRGPASGTAADVRKEGMLVAGIDPVAVDGFCTTMFGLEPHEVGFVQRAFNLGLGEMDLSKTNQQRIELA
ncbi:MAG: DUF362 domain-containing protein [Candidatus Hydrogenedentota bacterium]|nr:MAG: DUF362 domain-containing protein [Candidatus Hydrogenedentota bacterium]